jgi:hypothetical protein
LSHSEPFENWLVVGHIAAHVRLRRHRQEGVNKLAFLCCHRWGSCVACVFVATGNVRSLGAPFIGALTALLEMWAGTVLWRAVSHMGTAEGLGLQGGPAWYGEGWFCIQLPGEPSGHQGVCGLQRGGWGVSSR